MKVKELKEQLANHGYDIDTLDKLKKPELDELYKSIGENNKLLDAAEIIEEESQDGQKPEEQTPTIDSPEWTDYVISLLDKKEMDNGMPKTEGLRRVARKLLGVFSIRTNIHQIPTIDNAGRATVQVSLEFNTAYGSLVYDGAADVFSGNTQKEFAKHAVATAETRAEGRALRKALNLTKVLAAEEMYDAEPDEPNGTDKRIATGMLNSLNIMCDRVGVDLIKVAVFNDINIQVPEDLTNDQGIRISDIISKYKREGVPDEVKR